MMRFLKGIRALQEAITQCCCRSKTKEDLPPQMLQELCKVPYRLSQSSPAHSHAPFGAPFLYVLSMAQELYSLPGAVLGVDDEGTVEAGLAPVTYQQLLYGMAEQVRMLRSMKPEM
jgi:hypothetical protein